MSARGPKYFAKQAGLPRFFTGKPCLKGHIVERITHTGQCVECYRLSKRKWYFAHPEKMLEYGRKYREPRKDLLAQKARDRRESETPEQRILRLQSDRICKREYAKTHSEQAKQYKAQYLLAVKRQTPKWVGREEKWLIREAHGLAKLRTKLTNIQWCVDHYYPLQGKDVCGLHVPENIRVITLEANACKCNKNPDTERISAP